MTPEEERDYQEIDYEKAKRRIQEAKDNKSVELDLSGLLNLIRIPPELASLSSLQKLDLSSPAGFHKTRISACGSGDLSPLAGLESLQWLNLSECYQLVGDLHPLAELKSLQKLYLKSCYQLSDLSPLAKLASLQTLDLSGCGRLSDLSPLAGLESLQSLNLSWCSLSGDLVS